MLSRVLVVLCTIALSTSVTHAGNSSHGGHKSGHPSHGGHKNRGQSKHRWHRGKGETSYSIDPHTCAPTLTNTKRLKRIVLKNSDGEILAKWRRLKSKMFDGFGIHTAQLADSQLYVNGVEIGDDFRHALEACLLPECPYADFITAEVEAANFGVNTDTAQACVAKGNVDFALLNIPDGQSFGGRPELRGLGFAALSTEGCWDIIPLPVPADTSISACPTAIDGTLDSDQARACADLILLPSLP